jgi:hypothetical protein
MKHVNPLRPIDISWPFAIWGIDIMDILSTGHQDGSDTYSLGRHVHHVDGSLASGEHNPGGSGQVPAEHHI